MIVDAPGYFGKLPARGDFLSCRIAPDLAAAWDGWLTQLTVAVREAAGDAWPEAWLTAPLWHFTLGPGALPGAPGGGSMAGVLVASVDRVGRMFPFTIISPSGGIPDETWSDEAEALVLAALDDGFVPAELDAALERLGPPRATTAMAPAEGLWWSRGSDRVEPSRLLIRGMPSRADSAAMVLGVAAA